MPFGVTLALSYTGKVSRTIGGTDIDYGQYAVVDLSGRYFVDGNHKHQWVLSVQNIFDEQYGSPARGCADVVTDGPYDCSIPYFYSNLGLPRTVRAGYTYSF
jgi:vitamin B12 transporter